MGKEQALSREEIELAIIDSGADDFEENGDVYIIYTKPGNFQKVKEALSSVKVKIHDDELIYKPKTEVKITDVETARKIMKVIDALEEIEDVTSVYVNYDFSDEVMEAL